MRNFTLLTVQEGIADADMDRQVIIKISVGGDGITYPEIQSLRLVHIHYKDWKMQILLKLIRFLFTSKKIRHVS